MNKIRKIISNFFDPFIDRLIKLTAANRYYMLSLAFYFTRDESVDGDYFEFGVARGSTFIKAYKIAKKLGLLKSMNFYAFDSFEGFPVPEGRDKIFERFKAGGAKHSLDDFLKNLKKHKVDLKKVKILKGWFKDTLNGKNREILEIKSARVINIDCDMYSSTKAVLDFIKPIIKNGTVLMFDDWYCFRADPEKGEQWAVHEWLEKNPEIQLIQYNNYATVGKSFIAVIKNENKTL